MSTKILDEGALMVMRKHAKIYFFGIMVVFIITLLITIFLQTASAQENERGSTIYVYYPEELTVNSSKPIILYLCQNLSLSDREKFEENVVKPQINAKFGSITIPIRMNSNLSEASFGLEPPDWSIISVNPQGAHRINIYRDGQVLGWLITIKKEGWQSIGIHAIATSDNVSDNQIGYVPIYAGWNFYEILKYLIFSGVLIGIIGKILIEYIGKRKS